MPEGFQLYREVSKSPKSVMTQMLVHENWWLLWFIYFGNVYDTDVQRENNIRYCRAKCTGREQKQKFSEPSTAKTFLQTLTILFHKKVPTSQATYNLFGIKLDQ
jgi:hypothetical protein